MGRFHGYITSRIETLYIFWNVYRILACEVISTSLDCSDKPVSNLVLVVRAGAGDAVTVIIQIGRTSIAFFVEILNVIHSQSFHVF